MSMIKNVDYKMTMKLLKLFLYFIHVSTSASGGTVHKILREQALSPWKI